MSTFFNFLKRYIKPLTVTSTTSLGTTTAIDFASYSGGTIECDAAITITWYAASTKAGTYRAANSHTGAAITQAVSANEVYEIPPSLFGSRTLKPLSSSGTNTILVNLKS